MLREFVVGKTSVSDRSKSRLNTARSPDGTSSNSSMNSWNGIIQCMLPARHTMQCICNDETLQVNELMIWYEVVK